MPGFLEATTGSGLWAEVDKKPQLEAWNATTPAVTSHTLVRRKIWERLFFAVLLRRFREFFFGATG